jgi:hypothetical protein
MSTDPIAPAFGGHAARAEAAAHSPVSLDLPRTDYTPASSFFSAHATKRATQAPSTSASTADSRSPVTSPTSPTSRRFGGWRGRDRRAKQPAPPGVEPDRDARALTADLPPPLQPPDALPDAIVPPLPGTPSLPVRRRPPPPPMAPPVEPIKEVQASSDLRAAPISSPALPAQGRSPDSLRMPPPAARGAMPPPRRPPIIASRTPGTGGTGTPPPAQIRPLPSPGAVPRPGANPTPGPPMGPPRRPPGADPSQSRMGPGPPRSNATPPRPSPMTTGRRTTPGSALGLASSRLPPGNAKVA